MKSSAGSSVPESLGFEIGGPGRRYYDDVVLDNVVEPLPLLALADDLTITQQCQRPPP